MSEKINRYKTQELLGKGAFGRVFRGIDTATKQEVAIKIIGLKNIAIGILKQNINEVVIMSSIRSRYVCGFIDAFIEYTQGELWIILEFCSEGSVASLIDQHHADKTQVPENTVWRIFLQTLVGLRTLHRFQVIHRDIKPSNLLFAKPNQTVKISDFNVSDMAYSPTSAIVGTPSYIAPEVWRSSNYTFSCDIFALGCIIYEMMTCRTAFYHDNVDELREMILSRHPEKIKGNYSTELKNIVNGCMLKDFERRLTIAKVLTNPFVLAKARELGIDIVDEENAGYGMNRVTLVITKTYPLGKDSKEFHTSLVDSICRRDANDVLEEMAKPEKLSAMMRKSKTNLNFETDPNSLAVGKDAERLKLPIKKEQDVFEFPPESSVKNKCPFNFNPVKSARKEAVVSNESPVPSPLVGGESPIKQLRSKQSKDNTQRPAERDTKTRLDERELITETKLKWLLRMNLKIISAGTDKASIANPIAKSRSVVPNDKFREKVEAFAKQNGWGRKEGLGSNPNLTTKKQSLQVDPKLIGLRSSDSSEQQVKQAPKSALLKEQRSLKGAEPETVQKEKSPKVSVCKR